MSEFETSGPHPGPEISVVIATAGRAALLARTLDALAAQNYLHDRYEVIVIQDGPDEATRLVLERHQADRTCPVRFASLENRAGPAAARNAGIARVRGEIIAFTDDDCLADSGWLAAFRERFAREPHAVGLIGRTVTTDDQITPFSHFVENQDGQTHQTCNIAYRRDALEQLGGFDTAFPFSCEDTDLYVRARQLGPVLFEPDAVVVHPPRELTFSQIIRRGRNYEGDFIFYRKHPELYRERHRGAGPVFALVFYMGLKHLVRQAREHYSYGLRHPLSYFKFLAACTGERIYLFSLMPLFCWKHRLSR